MSCMVTERTVKLNYLNGFSAFRTFEAPVKSNEIALPVPGREGWFRLFRYQGQDDWHIDVREYDQIP